MKDQEKGRKINIEQLKLQMQKRIEGTSKNLALKKKPQSSKTVVSE